MKQGCRTAAAGRALRFGCLGSSYTRRPCRCQTSMTVKASEEQPSAKQRGVATCVQNGQGGEHSHPGRQGPAEVVLGEGPSYIDSLAWMPGVLAKG